MPKDGHFLLCCALNTTTTMSGISDQSGSNISIYLYTSVSYVVFKFLLVNVVFYAVGLNDVCGIQQLFTETTLFHNYDYVQFNE